MTGPEYQEHLLKRGAQVAELCRKEFVRLDDKDIVVKDAEREFVIPVCAWEIMVIQDDFLKTNRDKEATAMDRVAAELALDMAQGMIARHAKGPSEPPSQAERTKSAGLVLRLLGAALVDRGPELWRQFADGTKPQKPAKGNEGTLTSNTPPAAEDEPCHECLLRGEGYGDARACRNPSHQKTP